MNKRLKFGIVIVVLMLAIGFASVTTSIIVNSNVKLGFNESNFDIYFSSAIPEDDGTATIDSTTKKTITYSTKTLKNVGDQAILDYVVTNASTQYDANCTVEFIIDSGADEYVTITKTGFVENEAKVVNAQTSAGGRILITLKKVSMEPIQINFTLKLIFTPVGKEEESEPGQVPNSDDPAPSTPTCVPSGYYGIKCSCDDSTYIAWLDGPYKDINNVAMNPNRVRDINYPPSGTYICGCKNGQTGYVYNTGILLESECPEEEPEEDAPDENTIVEMRIDGRPTFGGNFYIPGYDDETGTSMRESADLDLYTQYKNATLEVVEVDGDSAASAQPVANSTLLEYVGNTGKKYSYKLHFRLPTSITPSYSFYTVDYHLKVTLRSKADPTKVYAEFIKSYIVDYYDTYDKESYEYEATEWYCGKEYKEMDYYQGVRPWATWFMNDGREDYCWVAECCE